MTATDSGTPTELQIFADEFGIVVTGPPEVASAAIDHLLDGTDPGPRSRMPVSALDGLAVAGTGGALMADAGEYLRLSAVSAAKVKELGEQLDGAGALRGWVKDGNKFAGQLTFDKVTLAPQQALALQAAAVSLALRTAIASVEQAVERVEAKVDQINARLDSRLRGDVIGTFRHLDHVAATTNIRGRILQADWDGVAGIKNQLLRDLETLRTHINRATAGLAETRRLPEREDIIGHFHRRHGDVGDMLQLVLVTEQSLHLWEYLRVQQVAAREAEHLSSALDDARTSLRREQELDAAMVERLRGAVDHARVVAPLEYRHLLTKNALTKEVQAFDERLREFATSSRLPSLDDLAPLTQPTFADAREEVGRRAADAGRTAKSLGSAFAKGSSSAAARGRDRARQALSRSKAAEAEEQRKAERE